MSGRKTIEVKWMLNWANKQLAYEGHNQQHKAGVCTMIERLLWIPATIMGLVTLTKKGNITDTITN